MSDDGRATLLKRALRCRRRHEACVRRQTVRHCHVRRVRGPSVRNDHAIRQRTADRRGVRTFRLRDRDVCCVGRIEDEGTAAVCEGNETPGRIV